MSTLVANLEPFQRRFLRGALAPGVRTAALSLPRGNGKSSLVAHLAHRALTPGDPLFVRGTESHIAAHSIGQARRTVFKLLREMLDGLPGYRIAETQNACHVVHTATNTRISVLATNGKGSQGLVRAPFVFVDEPGAHEVAGGEAMHTAIQTAQGKPGCELRAIYCGTLAPAASGWWHDLVNDGNRPGIYVQALRGDPAKWDRASEIRRCNPLMWAFPASRAVLLDERTKALADSRLKAAFMSFRLNIPSGDESTVLLTVPDWELVCGRELPPRDGAPIVAVDLGGGRAWSAAVALWRNGRTEALAVAPGVPGIEAQEKRDRVPAGTYRRLLESGALSVATGLRVPPAGHLVGGILGAWGRPEVIVCDRFRLGELLDASGTIPVVPRVARWSESTADIRALRRFALDGPLSCAPTSRALLTASLAVASVKSDDAGNVRLVKRGNNNQARDDVAAALALAAGALDRAPRRSSGAYLGKVG